MVRNIITVEEIFGSSKVKARMFITIDGPPEASESIAVSIDYNTSASTVPGISYLMSIPPKPLNKVAVSIISTRGDHF